MSSELPPPSEKDLSQTSTPTTQPLNSSSAQQNAIFYNPPQGVAGQGQPAAQQHFTNTPASASTSKAVGPSTIPYAQNNASGQASAQGYYPMSYPSSTWQNAWQMGGYPYTSGSGSFQQHHYAQIPYAQYQSQQYPVQYQSPAHQPRHRYKPAAKLRSPSPTPPPPDFRHWDEVIKAFLEKLGMTQSLRGFEDDMIMMNADWERQKVPGAIGDLMKGLMALGKENGDGQERPLEERKLDYVHPANGAEPRSQTSITKSISQFLAKNRARNDASNRAEFVESLTQKRLRLDPDAEISESERLPTCARTDAKHLDRDVQMKYDIAKNDEGPLSRTMKSTQKTPENTERRAKNTPLGVVAERFPPLDERLRNIEAHLAVRYVPSPPISLLDRLKFLEDHIVQLEKEYPPWAALHFNQPNRGWPPPPRPTPIIVPSHLTSSTQPLHTSVGSRSGADVQSGTGPESSSTSMMQEAVSKGRSKNKSSLHRAVMEKLEVQKAKSDLAGRKEGGNG